MIIINKSDTYIDIDIEIVDRWAFRYNHEYANMIAKYIFSLHNNISKIYVYVYAKVFKFYFRYIDDESNVNNIYIYYNDIFQSNNILYISEDDNDLIMIDRIIKINKLNEKN